MFDTSVWLTYGFVQDVVDSYRALQKFTEVYRGLRRRILLEDLYIYIEGISQLLPL